MDSKIILAISLICLVQISIAQNYALPNSERYGTNEFLEAFSNKDDFGSSLTLSGIEDTLKFNNGKLKECYEKFVGQYHNFGQWLSTEMRELALGAYYDLENKKKKVAEHVKNSLESIGNAMIPYPHNLLTFFEENQLEELKKFMKQATKYIELYDVEIFVEIDRFLKEVPNAQAKKKAEEVKKRYQEIRERAKAEAKRLTKYFQLCVMPRGDN